MKVFIGIEMNGPWKRHLADTAWSLKSLDVKGTYTYVDNYHLTLKFIGQMEQEKIELMDEVLSAALEEQAPFQLDIGEMGIFEKKNRGIYWMGVQPSKELQAIYELIEELMDKSGVERDDKPYQAHITLLRQGRPNDMIIRNTLELASLRVNEITLFESVNLNGKLTYVPIKRYPLEG